MKKRKIISRKVKLANSYEEVIKNMDMEKASQLFLEAFEAWCSIKLDDYMERFYEPDEDGFPPRGDYDFAHAIEDWNIEWSLDEIDFWGKMGIENVDSKLEYEVINEVLEYMERHNYDKKAEEIFYNYAESGDSYFEERYSPNRPYEI